MKIVSIANTNILPMNCPDDSGGGEPSSAADYDDEEYGGKEIEGSPPETPPGGKSKQDDSFVKRESRQILCLRLAVIAILLTAAAVIIYVVSLVSRSAEREEMETQYEGLSRKVTGKPFKCNKTILPHLIFSPISQRNSSASLKSTWKRLGLL